MTMTEEYTTDFYYNATYFYAMITPLSYYSASTMCIDTDFFYVLWSEGTETFITH